MTEEVKKLESICNELSVYINEKINTKIYIPNVVTCYYDKLQGINLQFTSLNGNGNLISMIDNYLLSLVNEALSILKRFENVYKNIWKIYSTSLGSNSLNKALAHILFEYQKIYKKINQFSIENDISDVLEENKDDLVNLGLDSTIIDLCNEKKQL